MKQHMAKVAASCYYHLRRLRQIRRRVGGEVATRLVLALIMSSIDYCNSVLAGLPQSTVAAQNAVVVRYRRAACTVGDLPQLRTKCGESAFSHAGPAVWNALPEDMRAVSDSVLFRKQLKTQFFAFAVNVR